MGSVMTDDKSRPNKPVKIAIAFLVVILAVVILVVVVRKARAYRVSVEPGEQVVLTIQTPMQRPLEHKSYAKQPGLPVTCRLIPKSGNATGVSVKVINTGHRIHFISAEVQVTASPDASPGVNNYEAEFTIDGQGGWPRANLVVTVGH